MIKRGFVAVANTVLYTKTVAAASIASFTNIDSYKDFLNNAKAVAKFGYLHL